MKRKLTIEQKNFIAENYANTDVKEIAKTLGVEPIRVYKFASSKGIKKETTRSDAKFSKEQVEFIIKNYANMSNQEISHKLDLDVKIIRQISRLNGVKKNKGFDDHYGLSYDKRKYIIKNSNNMTAAEIAEILNLKTYQITNFCKRSKLKLKQSDGINNGSSSLSIHQKRFIRDNYKDMSNKDIVENLNITLNQLHNYASSTKLTKDIKYCHNKINYIEILLNKRQRCDYDINNFINTNKETTVNVLHKSKHGKYEINENYFEIIDTEFKAYWLGFLYADGCVRLTNSNGKKQNSLEVGLASCDVEHIEKFKKSIQSTHPIKHKTLNDGKYHSDRITIISAKICNSLTSLGCTQRKSLTLKFPSKTQVPDYLVRHFIRGYFDGDGCIHINIEKRNVSVSFMGTESFLNSLQDVICEKLGITKTKMQTREGNKALSIQWGDIYSVEKIYKYLYKDCNIYLERKLKKFDVLYCLD